MSSFVANLIRNKNNSSREILSEPSGQNTGQIVHRHVQCIHGRYKYPEMRKYTIIFPIFILSNNLKNVLMKFFIDTANLEQIRRAHSLGVLDGVTTNPSLMAKENIRGEEACCRHYIEICNIVDGDVSAEVISTDFDGMVREGERLAGLHPNIVVKLPCTADGIRAVNYFSG